MAIKIDKVKNTKVFKRFLSLKNRIQKKLYFNQEASAIFLSQVNQGKFNRYDVVVRYLAIENHQGKNDFGWDLYERMQRERMSHIGKTPTKELISQSKESFITLIDSFVNKGFDRQYPIICNQAGELVDGSHRLACALYFKVGEIVGKKSEVLEIDYGLDWFTSRFSADEVDLMEKKRLEINNQTDINKSILSVLKSSFQDFGRGQFYQSLDEISQDGQRPTDKRFDIYQLETILAPHHDVLDIGCNCGFFALKTARQVNSVDGIEINPTLVEIGKVTQNYLNRFNANFYCSDFKSFDFNKKYHVIYSFAVHHWIGMDITTYGKTLHNLLNINGYIVFESQNIETIDKDFDEKVAKICGVGFTEEITGTLFDDGVINRKFVILKKS